MSNEIVGSARWEWSGHGCVSYSIHESLLQQVSVPSTRPTPDIPAVEIAPARLASRLFDSTFGCSLAPCTVAIFGRIICHRRPCLALKIEILSS
jgi:hypothetical protein